jgi:hypothetical protein
MDINGWLTVMTVFVAIFALLPREDLHILLHKTNIFEKGLIIFTLVILSPYLIYFPQLSQRFPFLKIFTIKNGFEPASIAFILFYITFIWCSLRLTLLKPKRRPNANTIRYYRELLNEKNFDEFFKIFIKHTSAKEIRENWELYWHLFFQNKFLDGIFNNRTQYLLQLWDLFSNNEEFKIIFRRFLQNDNSDYYLEIKEHWDTFTLRKDYPFLNNVLNANIQQSINNRVVNIISDFAQTHLISNINNDLYNKRPYYNRIKEEYGLNLPLYYHIRFYGLLHTSIITKKGDPEDARMMSFYSSMIDEIIEKIDVPQDSLENEYASNYHWLISQMGKEIENWVNLYGKKYFKDDSIYTNFIPFSFWLIIQSLIKGFDKAVVSQKFINSMAYYHMIARYFDYDLTEKFKGYIEENFLKYIPKEHLIPILKKSLDEEYAISISDFLDGKTGHIRIEEMKNVNRLYNYLKKEGKI